jgi:hypothetical protein
VLTKGVASGIAELQNDRVPGTQVRDARERWLQLDPCPGRLLPIPPVGASGALQTWNSARLAPTVRFGSSKIAI